jgi:hypothetical protein
MPCLRELPMGEILFIGSPKKRELIKGSRPAPSKVECHRIDITI